MYVCMYNAKLLFTPFQISENGEKQLNDNVKYYMKLGDYDEIK